MGSRSKKFFGYSAVNRTCRKWIQVFTLNYMDITNEWIKKQKKGSVVEKHSYIVDGIEYVVDGKYVFIHADEKEKNIADTLSKKYGKDVEFVPQIVFPQGIQTPDYLIDGDRYDLKSPNGGGENLIYGMIAKKRKQADNFIIDISDCPLDIVEIENQIEKLYISPRIGFLQKVVLMKDGVILKVYGRN